MHIGLACTQWPYLYVDKWESRNRNNIFTGVEDLEEVESGKAKVETVEDERYLGD